MTPQHPAAPETETDANGLTEAERDRFLHWLHGGIAGGIVSLWAMVEDVLTDRAAATSERVRVVEGERDAAGREIGLALQMHDVQYQRANREQARAESAEAAHEAEKAAHERLRGVAESIAYEHAATVDGEFGCCHDEAALRAGGRAAEFEGDEFEPIPPDCLGQKTLDRHLALLGGGEAR